MDATMWFLVGVLVAALVWELFALATRKVPTFTHVMRNAHPLVKWFSGFLVGLLVGHFWW